MSIDGGSPTTVTKACESDEQFQVDFFESPVVDFNVHTVIITNRGRSTDASFMFDNLVLYSNDIDPSMTSPPLLTTPTSTTPRVVPQSVSTHDPSSTQVLQASTSSTTSSTTTTSVSSSRQTSTNLGSGARDWTPSLMLFFSNLFHSSIKFVNLRHLHISIYYNIFKHRLPRKHCYIHANIYHRISCALTNG